MKGLLKLYIGVQHTLYIEVYMSKIIVLITEVRCSYHCCIL